VDGTHVYWTTSGSVRRRQKDGGGVIENIDTNGSPEGIALDATHVWWTHGTSVRVRAKSGGPIRTIASAEWTYAIAVDADWIYYSDYVDNQILRLPRCACLP
ncbi:MAG TPA: hypothetical protein VIU61_14325, partial [Kofleriaceae bacterium]